MKKILSFLILFSVSILTLSGCGSIEKEQAIKDTPHQIGLKGQMSASVIGFNFDESYKEADIIAQIKITEWLGEVDEELERTIFKAKLEKTYKNNVNNNLKEINLIQTGNSNYTIKDNPLFKINDRLILYLAKAEMEGYGDVYYILGAHTGIFRIVNSDGRDYVVKQVGNCPELSEAKVTADNSKIKSTLLKNITTDNPVLFFSSPHDVFDETYDLEKMEKLIEKQKNK
ncbi:hypothetical protein CLHUN_38030 [Ruminiclostridium hungatei]|uniref:Lipoprotein n=1 Tax=Ruminiclostridium hungatei TaxID=48256 RepID=A0A1V4SED9_RUMHU|nr:hypothetical protein [Ruminiclostridium hungatei]OPX42282.1 hypothetical protein CLHUN_38030 [Ruminiclostridium hungatei]